MIDDYPPWNGSTTPSLDAHVVSCLHRLYRLWQASTGRPRSRWNTREALSRKCHPSLNALGCDMLRLISKPIKEFQPFWGSVKGWNWWKLKSLSQCKILPRKTVVISPRIGHVQTWSVPIRSPFQLYWEMMDSRKTPSHWICDMLIQHLQPRLNQLPQLPHDYSWTWISSQSVLENRMLAAKVPSRSSKSLVSYKSLESLTQHCHRSRRGCVKIWNPSPIPPFIIMLPIKIVIQKCCCYPQFFETSAP